MFELVGDVVIENGIMKKRCYIMDTFRIKKRQHTNIHLILT